MSLIYSRPMGLDRWEVFCEACGVPTDLVSFAELSGMTNGGYRVFCPACDSQAKDAYHPLFEIGPEPIYLNIDGVPFFLNWPASAREQKRRSDFWAAAYRSTLEDLADLAWMRSLACLVLHKSTDSLKGDFNGQA